MYVFQKECVLQIQVWFQAELFYIFFVSIKVYRVLRLMFSHHRFLTKASSWSTLAEWPGGNHTISLTIFRPNWLFSKAISLFPQSQSNFILQLAKIAEWLPEMLETVFSDQELILRPQASSKINWDVCNGTWTEFEQGLEKTLSSFP